MCDDDYLRPADLLVDLFVRGWFVSPDTNMLLTDLAIKRALSGPTIVKLRRRRTSVVAHTRWRETMATEAREAARKNLALGRAAKIEAGRSRTESGKLLISSEV